MPVFISHLLLFAFSGIIHSTALCTGNVTATAVTSASATTLSATGNSGTLHTMY